MSPLHLHQWPTGSHLFQLRQAKNVSADYARGGRLAYRLGVTLAMGMSALLATGVQAQGNSCDMLQVELAERIDSSVRGYSMEALPATAPVPTGGKVIGTCEGGASKIVYFRFGRPRPAAGAANAPDTTAATATDTVATTSASSATTPTPAQVSSPTPAPSAPTPVVQAAVVVATPAPTTPNPSPRVAPAATAPATATPPATPSTALARPPAMPIVAQGNNTVAPSIPTKQTREKPVASSAPKADATSDAEPSTSFAPPFAPVVRLGVDAMNAPDTEPSSESIAKTWRWILALLVVVVAGALWAWRTHHNAYDEAGLPRGPRL